MIWIQLIKSLPEILGLLLAIQKRLDEDKVNRKVSDDLEAIKHAFHNRDATALNAIFNSSLSDSTAENKP